MAAPFIAEKNIHNKGYLRRGRKQKQIAKRQILRYAVQASNLYKYYMPLAYSVLCK